MPSRIETSSKSFANTLAFAEKASAIPLKRKPTDTRAFYPPKNPWQSDGIYIRNWEVTGRYLGGTETLEKIGVSVGLTREKIRQIVKITITTLHKRASTSVRRGVSLKNLGFGKPYTGSYISPTIDNS